MNGLRAVRSLMTLPVVTLGGDAVALVRDTVFDTSARRIASFTLSGPALLSRPLSRDLPWQAVHCLGRRAVMIRDAGALFALSSEARRDAARGRVLGAQVVTDDGDPLGTVLDVLVEGGTSGRIAAFRLAAHRHLVHASRHHRHQVYLPGGEALRITGRTLVVPARVTAYVTDDLPGFVARVDALHGRAGGGVP
ncbi:PRC-barrel domain-containing protein [Streptomyces sp. NPDC052492]|uniref:PRC-barrel domain-containing protein n=1 Tax=unclassified Streptomyces TaxID=2593676 RepID=UPI0037D8D0F4